MDLGPHAGFILAAYAAAALTVAALIAWVMADHRAQRRMLARLEQQGVTRRSAAAPVPPAAGKIRNEAT